MRFIDRLSEFKQEQIESEYVLKLSGDEYRFRYWLPTSLEQYERLASQIKNFVDITQSPACPPDWEEFLPISASAAEKVGLVHALVTELIYPDSSVERLTERDWLLFAQRAGWQFLQLATELIKRVGESVADGEQEALTSMGES